MNPNIVRSNINKSMSHWHLRDDDGGIYPIVCLLCDCFIVPDNKRYLSIVNLRKHQDLFYSGINNPLNERLKACYRIQMPVVPIAAHIRDTLHLDRCLLSKRSKFILDSECNGERCGGFPICNKCFQAIRRGKCAKFAIANNYCFGRPPSCLSRLTDVELAFLTPVKTYGYSFCYTGGQKHKLVGSLSYY
jgi:hypothetical protein